MRRTAGCDRSQIGKFPVLRCDNAAVPNVAHRWRFGRNASKCGHLHSHMGVLWRLSLKMSRCYTFAARRGARVWLGSFPSPSGHLYVLNSVDAGRRLMLRAAVYPLAAVVILALAFLFMGPRYALGALVSGVAVVGGSALAAWVGLGGGVQTAGSAMVRMFVGLALKLVLIVAVLGMAFFWWRLPPLALLAAIPVALMFQVLALARR